MASVANARRPDSRDLRARVDTARLRSALADADPLPELSDRGLLRTASVDEFEFRADASAFVDVTVDGRPARVLTAGRSVDGGPLRVGVHPGSGEAFGLLERGGDVVEFGAVADATPAAPTLGTGATTSDDCDNWCCDTYWCSAATRNASTRIFAQPSSNGNSGS